MPHFFTRAWLLACAVLTPAAAAGAAPPVHDRILTYGSYQTGLLARAELPAGPGSTVAPVAPGIGRLYVLPSGQVLATSLGTGPARTLLNELRPDGSLRQIGALPAHPNFPEQWVVDMALDHRGRFYLLVQYSNHETPASSTHLIEVDPATAAVLSTRAGTAAYAIATAPDGLWALVGSELRKLDPDTLALGPPVVDLGLFFGFMADLDADSAGRLYFRHESPCSPPCPMIGTVDPATGLVEDAPEVLYERAGYAMRSLAIDRRCHESATVRCLQGGRFRAEIEYAAYDGAAGPATAAPARSGDTAIFSFFDPDNWELMVKVLDGCAINGNFWVYASASTDVGYTMTITDTQTGAQKVYGNALGQVARTVTDNVAFSCQP